MKSLKKITRIIALSLLLTVFSTTVVPCLNTTVQAATISISKKTLSLKIGKTYPLKVTGTKKDITWKSSDKTVASVSKKGKVTAQKAGQAKITATVGNKKFTCTVTVKAYTYKVKESSFEYDGKKIYGMTVIPEGIDGKIPTVINSHGFNSNYQSSLVASQMLAEMGYASYCFDFCGGSEVSKSDGAMTDMSILTEKDDLNAIIDYVKTLKFVDTDNLFLAGASQGGCVSGLVAAERADEIKGLILLCPAFNIPDLVAMAAMLYPTPEDIPATVTMMGATIGKRYYTDAVNYDIYGKIGKYEKDVLIFHGDQDAVVDISYAKKALEVYKSAKLVVEKGQGHNLYTDLNTIIPQVSDFIRTHIN